MKSYMKRFLALFLCALMVLPLLSVNADEGIRKSDETTVDEYCFYDADGSLLSSQLVQEGEVVYAPATPEQLHQRFTGWDDGTGELKTGSAWAAAGVSGKTVSLHPTFEDSLSIVFHYGDTIVKTIPVTPGEHVAIPDISLPLSGTQRFVGWYEDEEHLYPVSNPFPVEAWQEEDIHVYALVEEGHFITLDANGGDPIDPVFVPAGEPTDEWSIDYPFRDGYEFTGWVDENGNPFEFGNPLDRDITLTATWQTGVSYYNVIIWEQSDTDTVNAETKHYDYVRQLMKGAATGSTAPQPLDMEPREGFHFASADENITITPDGSAIQNVYFDRDVIHFHFVPETGDSFTWSGLYNSLFSISGYSFAPELPLGKGWHVNNHGNYVYLGFLERFNRPTYLPYTTDLYLYERTMDHWTEDTIKETSYDFYTEDLYDLDKPHDSDDLSNYSLRYKNPYLITSEFRLLFSEKFQGFSVYRVKLHDSHGKEIARKVKSGDSISYLSFTPNPEQNIYYKRNVYQVNFYNETGDYLFTKKELFEADLSHLLSEVPDDVSAPQCPYEDPEHYQFAGWYKDNAEPFDFSTMPAHNLNLYAHWTLLPYTVRFYDEDGTFLSSLKADYGTALSDLDIPTPSLSEGDRLAGWTLDNLPVPLTLRVNRDMDLYARVIRKSNYAVIYHRNDGSQVTGWSMDNYAPSSTATLSSCTDLGWENAGFVLLEHGAGRQRYLLYALSVLYLQERGPQSLRYLQPDPAVSRKARLPI